ADNPVRFIDAFVDELALAALGLRHVVAAAPGRPRYQPGDLLKLYIDGYLYRVRSSRRLEQETQRNVELMWRRKKLRPEHKTIANFRRDHLQPLRAVCRPLTLLCKSSSCSAVSWWRSMAGSAARSTRRGGTSPQRNSSRASPRSMRGWRASSKSWKPRM